MKIDIEEISKRIDIRDSHSYCNLTTQFAFKDVGSTKVVILPTAWGESFNIDGNSCNLHVNRVCRACFNELYTFLNTKPERLIISVYIPQYKDRTTVGDILSCTWMTKEQLEEHVQALKNDLNFDFEFNVLENEKETLRKFIVNLDTKELFPLQIKYILAWIRYSYEFSYTNALLSAYLLKNEYDLFKQESITNIVLVTLRYFWDSNAAFCEDHKISSHGKPRKPIDTIRYLNHNRYGRLSDIYPRNDSIKILELKNIRYESIGESLKRFKSRKYKFLEIWEELNSLPHTPRMVMWFRRLFHTQK